ncbi:MAG: N-acetyltransferase [Candidatus Eremiobacteraeota bacterium]|nr:N-acetyltransferase [Candidatus Eremiobacteraeota bacterium]MBC5803130.1 N-acetyltransferase [Candidatus Eremiobacteraeota bacterium]MBC5822741.1 N-acetyltransferase [Candidatus Eremiobacteraeota bacterium]
MTFAVRSATAGDAGPIAAIYAPIVEATHISFEEIAPTESQMRTRIKMTCPRLPWLVAESDLVLGYAYASEHRARSAYRWSVDVALYVAATARRGGVGRTLYTALFAILTEQGYYNAFAGTTLPNEASVALHRALGFEPVGIYRNVGYKQGRWWDVAWWQRPLAAPQPHPAEPTPLAALASRVPGAQSRA